MSPQSVHLATAGVCSAHSSQYDLPMNANGRSISNTRTGQIAVRQPQKHGQSTWIGRRSFPTLGTLDRSIVVCTRTQTLNTQRIQTLHDFPPGVGATTPYTAWSRHFLHRARKTDTYSRRDTTARLQLQTFTRTGKTARLSLQSRVAFVS